MATLSFRFVDILTVEVLHIEGLGGQVRVHYEHQIRFVNFYSVCIHLFAYTMLLLAAYHLSPLKNPIVLVGVHFEEPTGWYVAPNFA